MYDFVYMKCSELVNSESKSKLVVVRGWKKEGIGSDCLMGTVFLRAMKCFGTRQRGWWHSSMQYWIPLNFALYYFYFILFFIFSEFIYFLFIYFLAALGLHCCTRAFSSCGERGLLSLRCVGFLLWRLLLLQSMGSRCAGSSSCGSWAQQLWLAGSITRAQQLWHPGLVALWHVGSSPDQGSNPCPLYWQADS